MEVSLAHVSYLILHSSKTLFCVLQNARLNSTSLQASRGTTGSGAQTPCTTEISEQTPFRCSAPETMCMAVWDDKVLQERKCDPAQKTGRLP